MSELDLEKRARQLVGQSLSAVHYQKAGWAEPTWEIASHPDLHTVDLSVTLETAKGDRHWISWADEFNLHHGFGVTLKPIKVVDRDRGMITEMTGDPHWQNLLGQPITAALIHWERIREALRISLSLGVSICADYLRRLDYPQALELVFADGGRVRFDASRMEPNGKKLPFTNNLLVSFSPVSRDRR